MHMAKRLTHCGHTLTWPGMPGQPRFQLQRSDAKTDRIARVQCSEFFKRQRNKVLPVCSCHRGWKPGADACVGCPFIVAHNGGDDLAQRHAMAQTV